MYKQFSKKTEPTLDNITKNILNGSYQHTDETCTKEDGILNNFYGTIISIMIQEYLNMELTIKIVLFI